MYRKFLLNEYHDYFCLFLLPCIGYKVCLHVHGVFPYIYIPCDGSAPPDKMGHHIVMALDRAVNILQGQGTSLWCSKANRWEKYCSGTVLFVVFQGKQVTKILFISSPFPYNLSTTLLYIHFSYSNLRGRGRVRFSLWEYGLNKV